MKILYIVRHAKSSWESGITKDFDRPLNNRGNHSADIMSKFISEKEIKIEKIVSSPAKRAITTAKIFAKALKINESEIQLEEKIYEASLKTLLEVVHELDDSVSSVMLFGHNPGLTSLANNFGAKIDNLPTCAIVAFEFDAAHWDEVKKGKLLFYEYPKKHINED
ncbi:MAG: histidine phosphatase family protein [Ignavibacteria bacterium]|nr:histidine phosphatase family protein [Ignavibacteria bacterium]